LTGVRAEREEVGMKKAGAIGLRVLALAGLLTACEIAPQDDGGQDVGADDATGVWSGDGRYRTGTPIYSMVLELTQTGTRIEGTYTVDRAGRYTMRGQISGLLDGSAIQMEFTPHGKAYGTVDGNSMSLQWYESGYDGRGEWGTVVLRRRQ
jgi:hypothetical protein